MSRVAVVVKGYPRLSETFIAQEILGLEQHGIEQLIVSLRHPTDKLIHEVNRKISANVLYLPEYLKDDPKRVATGRKWAKSQPTYQQARRVFEADLKRDRSVNRWRRWGQACVLGLELPSDVTWLHSHYLHTPCSVTRYAAMLRGLKWSFSAHAKDIWTSREWELREKIAACSWGVTCTEVNVKYLKNLSNEPEKIELVYHGLDLSRFPTATKRSLRSNQPIQLISVGRAVEKKGYGDLLSALYLLREDPRWQFVHIGGGSLLKKLKSRANRLGISNRISWHGPKEHKFVIDAMMRADLFVLPCRIAKSGDRDGLPNVLMEAQALNLPVIVSNISAVPELIRDGVNGLLTAANDPESLAMTIKDLIDNQDKRIEMGVNGARIVREKFSCEPGIQRLAKKFRESMASE